MAGIRKRVWYNSSGKHTCYEINCVINGQQVRKSGYKTKEAAQKDLNNVTKEISTDIKLYELCNLYINEHCLLRCKESTITLYESYRENRLNDLRYKKTKDINKRDIDLLILEWKRNSHSNKSINDVIGFLRSVFNYGIANKWISNNPAKEVKKLPKESREIKYLTLEEMKAFLNVIQTFPIRRYTPLLLAIYSGMRISELLALEWSDIDFKNNTITVNKQFYKGRLSTTKTYRSTRKISIPKFVIEKLMELKQSQKVLSKLIFCSDSGGYISQDKFVAIWFKKAMQAIGKPDYNFHCLRHTYATFLLSNSVPIKFVQEHLGHSTAQTTLNVYGHVMPNINFAAMNLLKNLEFEHDLNTVDFANAESQ